MKKILALTITAILSFSVFTGCATDADNKDKVKQTNKTLTFWDASATQYVSYEGDFAIAISEFKKKFPEVELIIEKHDIGREREGREEFHQKLATACMAGQGPDIVYADWSFMITQDIFKMQQAGAFADLTDFIATDKEFDANDYNKVILDGVKYEDKQYIMPLTYKMPIIYSPRETFEREGFNEKNFGTAEGIIDEFIAFRERNPDNGKKLFTDAWFFCRFHEYMGLGIIDNINKKADLNNELFKKTIEFWKTNYEFEDYNEAGIFLGGFDLTDYFPDKNVAFGSDVLSFDNFFSKLRDSTQFTDEVLMLPWRDTKGGVPVQLSTAMMINSASANKQNAWEFIKCVLSSQPSESDAVAMDGIPFNKEAWVPKFKLWTGELYDGNMMLLPGDPLTQADLDKFIKLQDEITSVYLRFANDRETYYKFLPYFEGEATYEECEKAVQEFWDLYLSE